ncbi:hypothetical protein HWV62_17098 [Athelia sp. TMB]|nr:hypothetical protein HWV62_17098 [Athelia sp. TMB]
MTQHTSSLTLATAPGDCCVAGFKHKGTPGGRTVEIAGVKTYVVEPKHPISGPKKVIFWFADVYGPLYLNNQLVQDYFGTQGFTVLGPDYFFGDPVQNHDDEEGFDRQAWIAKSRRQADACVPGWLEATREKYGTAEIKYAAVGYCFGAPYTLDLAAGDTIVAAAFAHPSFLEASHFEKLNKPLLLSCAEDDPVFTLESRRNAEDILRKNKAQYHFQVFSGVSHGFATKGDPNDPNVTWAHEDSARGIASWFKRFNA